MFFRWFAVFLVVAAFSMGFACDKVREQLQEDAETILLRPGEKANETRLQRDLQTMERALMHFNVRYGRYPENLKELTEKGVLTRIPKEPFGGEWQYDADSGEIRSSTHPAVKAF